ncbi:hypothetical protein POF51_22490 [Brevibacillus sp. AG]|uniref:hypothetical protein n=1 Tax=Brevibacillus sp. AG TaxID=3020891 RepID=UPI002330EF15|nr:hypothetical protein [Brevibacillus sp. AG]MDC0763498.1 hypothetical protein [Brevibacillus sp. AG]
MPILRDGVTADSFYTPDIYIEEQVPDIPEQPAGVSSKVMGIIGQFQKGSVNDVITVVGEKQFKEKMGAFLDNFPGSKAAFTAFKRGVQKLILVNVRGAGATQASLVLKDRASTPVDTMKISKKDHNAFGNECTVEVANGTNAGSFKIILVAPGLPTEVYDNNTTPQEAVDAINKLSKEFIAENLNSATAAPGNLPKIIAATKLVGGSDGSAPTATHYKGSTDSSTGKKTGLELMKTSIEVTDIVTDTYVSDVMNDALPTAAETMNWFTYLPMSKGTSVSTAITTRSNYDTEFAHLSLGWAKSRDKGWWVPVAVYDCIAHVLNLVQDGTAGFTFADIDALDVELNAADYETLSAAQVVCMGQMLDAQRNLVYGLKSDYTLSKDPRYKQTFRRRITSLLETDLYILMTPYRSKHISKSMLDEAEIVTRKYFDDRIAGEMIQGYTIAFTPPEKVGNVDELIEDLKVDLYNIADKIRIRLLSATNAL